MEGFINATHITKFAVGMVAESWAGTYRFRWRVLDVDTQKNKATLLRADGEAVAQTDNPSKWILDLDSVWVGREYVDRDDRTEVAIHAVSRTGVIYSRNGWLFTRTFEGFHQGYALAPEPEPVCPVAVGDVVKVTRKRGSPKRPPVYGRVKTIDGEMVCIGCYGISWRTHNFTRLVPESKGE